MNCRNVGMKYADSLRQKGEHKVGKDKRDTGKQCLAFYIFVQRKSGFFDRIFGLKQNAQTGKSNERCNQCHF